MTREISAANIAETEAEVMRPVNFVQLEFVSGTVYANNSPMTISFGGNEYLGVGSFGSISPVEEGGELQSYSVIVSLSGIDNALISEALSTGYKNRTGTILLGLLDINNQLVDDPFVLFSGKMDTMPIDIDNESTISLTIESPLADWERARIRRYTDEDQQRVFPGDKFFEFVPEMVDKQLNWGQA